MARCLYCDHEMSGDEGNEGCVPKVFVKIENLAYRPATRWDGPGNCHDCNCQPGTYHHTGCDMERCPFCQGQAIACGCVDETPLPCHEEG